MKVFFVTMLCVSAVVLSVAGQAGVTIGYYTDWLTSGQGWSNAITANGFTPVEITNMSTFDLGTVDILTVEYISSTQLTGRLGDIQTWVSNGGTFIVHDWTIPNAVGNKFVFGVPNLRTVAFGSRDINVPPGSPFNSGPFGLLDDTSLDGGNLSAHGYILASTLPSHATFLLAEGSNTNWVVAFSCNYGAGHIYYSSIPIGYYLGNYYTQSQFLLTNMNNVYTPNLLTYMNPVPEPSTILNLLFGLGGVGGIVWRRRSV